MHRFVGGRDFFTVSAAGFCARQKALTGQALHFGFRATQMSAPRSSNAELKVAAPDFGRRLAAFCQRMRRPELELIDLRKLKSRARTRPVFASTIGTD